MDTDTKRMNDTQRNAPDLNSQFCEYAKKERYYSLLKDTEYRWNHEKLATIQESYNMIFGNFLRDRRFKNLLRFNHSWLNTSNSISFHWKASVDDNMPLTRTYV